MQWQAKFNGNNLHRACPPNEQQVFSKGLVELRGYSIYIIVSLEKKSPETVSFIYCTHN